MYVTLMFVVFSMCCAVVPINWQSARASADANQHHSDNSHTPKSTPTPDSTTTKTLTINKFGEPQQADASGDTNNNGKKSPSYLQRLVTAESLPNTILCIVGILGILAAFVTLLFLSKQTKLMSGSVHVDGVRTATELAESHMQVFFVTVVNAGLIAKHVSMTMEVDIAGNTTKYQDSISMMVPANGTRDFSITSCIGINEELLQRLNGDTLRVRGRITWGKGKKETEDYCYKYNRCPLVPVPEGFPKFVPCDFDTRMAVSIGGRSDGKSTGTGTLTAL